MGIERGLSPSDNTFYELEMLFIVTRFKYKYRLKIAWPMELREAGSKGIGPKIHYYIYQCGLAATQRPPAVRSTL